MSRRVVGHDQHWCLAGAHEVSRHTVQEVGLDAEEIMEVCLNGLHVQVRPPGEQFGCPVITTPLYMWSRSSGRCPTGWPEDGGHDALGCPLHELPGKAAADAVAHVEELVDAQVIHQPELVVGEGAPGSLIGIGPLDSPPLALRWSIVMQWKSLLNSSMALITAVGQLLMREFNPHRA